MISIKQILKTAVREGASDIHITAGVPPVLRIRGSLIRLNTEILTPQQTKELCYSTFVSNEQRKVFEAQKDVDFSFSLDQGSRFRVHLFYQKNGVAGSFRQIPSDIPTIEDINLPPVIMDLAKKPYGLVLVAGATGSGKSTTLATMINAINTSKKCHILTVEDPIEFIYPNIQSIVNQREVGIDVVNFEESLRAALRMDPDVCLLGEIRDQSTVRTALEVAETGHLTFGTVHTNTSYLGIERLTSMFRGAERLLVQYQLSTLLQGVICQKLLPTADGKGRVPAVEVLLFPQSVRHLVREGQINQIYSIMQTQKSRGMITMNQSLATLVLEGMVDKQVALLASNDQLELAQLIKRSQKIGA